MSTFEMVCWGLIAIYATVVLTGIGFLILSGKRVHPESDELVRLAHEEQLRAEART